ncbi:hypothetical protein GCM10018962_92600 [Dactylosporangium matsuzakiense]|uniref:Uncharacterized protein n=1 Tax=Dactylosporangium matsuzakiense TaxID=53360 RepID=A0A9W6NLK7_9ACTN|nr:hypothetical protein GCM10017581_038070 [Dactylosporangium matsuzakiense]
MPYSPASDVRLGSDAWAIRARGGVSMARTLRPSDPQGLGPSDPRTLGPSSLGRVGGLDARKRGRGRETQAQRRPGRSEASTWLRRPDACMVRTLGGVDVARALGRVEGPHARTRGVR